MTMKQLKVLNQFRDINNFHLVHEVGEVMEADDSRASNLIERGLAEEVMMNDTDKANALEEKKKVTRKPRTPKE